MISKEICINVNSWIECAHYVNGGWFNSQLLMFQGDKYNFISAFCCFINVTIFLVFLYKKKKISKIVKYLFLFF